MTFASANTEGTGLNATPDTDFFFKENSSNVEF
jgi:hypothetical protein